MRVILASLNAMSWVQVITRDPPNTYCLRDHPYIFLPHVSEIAMSVIFPVSIHNTT